MGIKKKPRNIPRLLAYFLFLHILFDIFVTVTVDRTNLFDFSLFLINTLKYREIKIIHVFRLFHQL